VEACQQRALSHKRQGSASFLAVYIQEAHAHDEWPVGKKISFCNQHKSLSSRCRLAKDVKSGEFDILVDNMQNGFQSVFAAWPFRFYIFYDDKILLKGQPDEQTFLYNVDQIFDCLDRLKK